MGNRGICPVCIGTAKMPLKHPGLDTEHDEMRRYGKLWGWYGYSEEATADGQIVATVECGNCGSQYMHGRATGQVPLRPDGKACRHSYASESAGKCLTRYTCRHCSDAFTVDSGG